MVQATSSRAMMMLVFCPKCALLYAVASVKQGIMYISIHISGCQVVTKYTLIFSYKSQEDFSCLINHDHQHNICKYMMYNKCSMEAHGL